MPHPKDTRVCRKCLQTLPIAAFDHVPPRPNGRLSGYHKRCRDCRMVDGRGKYPRPNPSPFPKSPYVCQSHRTCKACGNVMPVAQFDGRRQTCKTCEPTAIPYYRRPESLPAKRKAQMRMYERRRAWYQAFMNGRLCTHCGLSLIHI